MSESIRVILGQDAEFDKLVHGGLPQAGPVTIAVKDGATQGGMPGAVISFPVQLPDGSVKLVQATMTLRLLVGFYSAVRGRYGPGGPQSHRYQGLESPFINYGG
jgi:hypothetical protein